MSAAKVTVKVAPEPVDTPATVTRSDRFGRFAARCSHYLGSRWAFVSAIAVIVVWGITARSSTFLTAGSWSLIPAQPS